MENQNVSVDASEIGLSPGFFPFQIEHAGKRWVRGDRRIRNGELLYIEYHTGTDEHVRETLTVFND